MTELAAELGWAQSVLREQPEVIADLGLHQDARLWGWIGIAHVTVNNLGFYHPDPSGQLGYITPVRTCPDPTVPSWKVVRFGDLVDLICWHPKHPFRWALRTGNGLVLGHQTWGLSQTTQPNPHQWLISGGRGICPLQQASTELAA